MLRLFVAEDHDLMRKMLVTLLEKEPDFTVCGEATSGREALALLDDAEADVLLVDISMGDMDGLTLLREVQARWPHLRCIVLSGHSETVYGPEARAAGALAYLDKRIAREIVPGIRKALAAEGGAGNDKGAR